MVKDEPISRKKVGYQEIISRVLAFGYNASISIMVVGLLLYIIGLSAFALIVIKAGLLALLATPLLRVAASAIVFYFIERDRRYALVSVAVFFILTASIFIGREM